MKRINKLAVGLVATSMLTVQANAFVPLSQYMIQKEQERVRHTQEILKQIYKYSPLYYGIKKFNKLKIKYFEKKYKTK